MPEGKHTPTPWRLSETDAAVVLAADHKDPFGIRYAVAFCEPCVPLNGDGDYGQFNAAQIVLAVNAHDDLVRLAREVILCIRDEDDFFELKHEARKILATLEPEVVQP